MPTNQIKLPLGLKRKSEEKSLMEERMVVKAWKKMQLHVIHQKESIFLSDFGMRKKSEKKFSGRQNNGKSMREIAHMLFFRMSLFPSLISEHEETRLIPDGLTTHSRRKMPSSWPPSCYSVTGCMSTMSTDCPVSR